jgi:hypothetical protein
MHALLYMQNVHFALFAEWKDVLPL